MGGKDHVIRIFDANTMVQEKELKSSGQDYPGHANRIFSVKYTDNAKTLVSGGWDNTVKFWDVQNGK